MQEAINPLGKLKARQITLHCGLHKTGTSYFQLNCRNNSDILLENGVLYIDPKTLKSDLIDLWQHIDTGTAKTTQEFQQSIQEKLSELCRGHEEKISTILISHEAIFGTLHFGLFHNPDVKLPPKGNQEDEKGLYRYAAARTRRLMQAMEKSLETTSIKWKILFAHRNQEKFIQSCHNQYIREGNHLPPSADLKNFLETRDFSFSDKFTLESSLSKMIEQLPKGSEFSRSTEIVPIKYELISNRQNPQDYFWNLLNSILPEQALKLSANTKFKVSNKKSNTGLNERGLELAIKCRPYFTEEEWKFFRGFLARHFSS